jgi:hypothetical protein
MGHSEQKWFAGSLSGFAFVLAGCGAGVTGAALSAGSSSSNSSPPTLTAFTLENPKNAAAARVRFLLSRPATVALFVQVDTSPARLLTQVGANPRAFAAGVHELDWNFATEPELDASFRPLVRVFALLPGIQEEVREGENAFTSGLGNDPPLVADLPELPPEVDGVVAVRMSLADSSEDELGLRVEFAIEGDGRGFRPARPGGLDAFAPTPDPAL